MTTLLWSPPFWAAVGCVIVTWPVSYIGSSLFFVALIWTAFNELRVSQSKQTAPATITSASFQALIREKINSPGLFPFIQSLIYFISAIDASATGNYQHTIIMIMFAMGALAHERVANLEYRPPERDKLSVENILTNFWQKLPQRVRIILQDPGTLFCLGNVCLVLLDFNFQGLSNSLILSIIFYFGLGFAGLGLIRGFAPLFLSDPVEATGAAVILGGVANIFLGTASFFYGNIYFGIALIIWGYANILYGVRLNRTQQV